MLYSALNNSGTLADYAYMRNCPTPLKVKVHDWLVMRNRLLTEDRMVTCMSFDLWCALCGEQTETSVRLLIQRPFVQSIGRSLMHDIDRLFIS